jgi:L-asparaginase
MIRLIATGGTIASLPDASGAVRPAVAPEDLVAGVPGLAELGPVDIDEVTRVSGWNVDPATMLTVARRVQAAADDDAVAGIVVTHGTDTVEETAFLCDVLVGADKPVVFAAAMRSGDEVAADGPRNLLNAARVATAAEAKGLGVVVTLNDEIHAARWARKQDSRRVSAFTSPGHGPVGFVAPGSVRIVARPVVVPSLGMPAAPLPPVPVSQTFTGMPEGLIGAVVEATGAAGLVLDGTGLGNVPGTAMPGIEAALVRDLPVIIATRVPTGGTGAVYGGPGGGVTLAEMGVAQAGPLPAAKARLLLMVLLASGVRGADAAAQLAERAAGLALAPGPS